MDIHTGGVDLKFPHHDNEIAQAEVSPATWVVIVLCEWQDYFLSHGQLPLILWTSCHACNYLMQSNFLSRYLR